MVGPRIGIVGATGLVGHELLMAFEAMNLSPEQLILFGSEHSEEDDVDYGGETLGVEKVEGNAFRELQAVVLACPAELSKAFALQAQAQGVYVVDVTGAFSADASVPCIAAGINDEVLLKSPTGRIVSLAHPLTHAVLHALSPLRTAGAGFTQAHIVSLHGASTAGREGIRVLESETVSLLGGKDHEAEIFPHRLAFNIIPQVGTMENKQSFVERNLHVETGRVWDLRQSSQLQVTALQVPTFHGLTAVLSVSMAQAADQSSALEMWKKSKYVKVLDEPDDRVYPMPMLATGDPSVHIGRVRFFWESSPAGGHH